MPSRKLSLLQMHLKSNWPHPAMPLPVVYLSTQGCYTQKSVNKMIHSLQWRLFTRRAVRLRS